MGEWRDKFDKGLKKAIQDASMMDNAPSTVDFKQMLKNSTDIEKKGKKRNENEKSKEKKTRTKKKTRIRRTRNIKRKKKKGRITIKI